MADVVCLGEVLIDFVPTITPTTLTDAPAFKKAPGGAPANVAVGPARLGVRSAFMGKVGDDQFGHVLVQTLADAGVDVAFVRFSSDARTALAFVSPRADGDREFMFYRHPSADMLFHASEVDAEAIQRAKLLHYGTISLISEPSRSATLHAIELAREAGCSVSCDPNLRLALWPDRDAAREGLLSTQHQPRAGYGLLGWSMRPWESVPAPQQPHPRRGEGAAATTTCTSSVRSGRSGPMRPRRPPVHLVGTVREKRSQSQRVRRRADASLLRHANVRSA